MMNCATRKRFVALCLRCGLSADRAGTVWLDLLNRYTEKHRSYHNLSHIDWMLSRLDRGPEGSDVIELAIWFHDSIYQPLEGDNEAQSARHFSAQFGNDLSRELADDVVRLIVATDPMQSRSGKADEALIVDIDLSILGAAPADYAAYRKAVRSEYSAVQDTAFAAGRDTILKSFMSAPIYTTEFFSELEDRARLNITAELAILESAM